MKCTFKGSPGYGTASQVILTPVYSPDPESENRAFWEATPQGTVNLVITNPAGAAVFEAGEEYFVDFTRSDVLARDKGGA
jgi:hypothetical protein